MSDPTDKHEEHGWIDPSGFEVVETDAEVDEGALA